MRHRPADGVLSVLKPGAVQRRDGSRPVVFIIFVLPFA